jgi:hypothetical protein
LFLVGRAKIVGRAEYKRRRTCEVEPAAIAFIDLTIVGERVVAEETRALERLVVRARKGADCRAECGDRDLVHSFE